MRAPHPFWVMLAACVAVSGCSKKTARVFSADEQPPALEAARTDAPKPAADEKPVEIKEKLFISQINDIYLSQQDYLGKKIRLQGLFKTENYGGEDVCFVLRYGPGCCGNDGNVGFEVSWEDAVKPYPRDNDWVEAVGTLKTYTIDDYEYLYLALSELNALEKRGAEFVSQ